MTNLFLSPHFDDETLFGAFTICRDPTTHIVVCFMPRDDSEKMQRMAETHQALGILCGGRADWTVLNAINPHPEKDASLPLLSEDLQYIDSSKWYDNIYAPGYEKNGNADHNYLHQAANGIFGNRVINYSTYSWPEGKTRGHEVEPKPEWISRKLRALACYTSQIKRPETRDHFLGDLREYYD